MWEIAEWLGTTPLFDLSNWLSTTGFSQWIQFNFWVIPTLQTIHILAIAAVFGSAFMINLRILELAGRGRTMTWTASRYLPWIWWGLPVLLLTGALLIIGEPHRELLNPSFWIKMILILVAIAATLWFQGTVRKNIAFWETSHTKRVAIRICAVAAIVLWGAIIVFGRWIAYSPVGV
jgi:hypothetical protein